MSRVRGKTLRLTTLEIEMLVMMVGKNVDPKNLKYDSAKALVHKCKDHIARPAEGFQIVP